MKIFLDTANLKEINKYLEMGIIDGVTTNPTILLKDKVDLGDFAKFIMPYPVSLEVTTNDLNEMIKQALILRDLSPNVVIKIPQENQFGEPCYKVIHDLESAGVRVNATVAMSFGQVIFSAKAKATYISIFAGRLGDEGGNASEVIGESVDWLENWGYSSQIIVGSIRSVADVLQAVNAGAHIITIPPDIMKKMADHRYTRETVKQFVEDANK
jgi:transaldolase